MYEDLRVKSTSMFVKWFKHESSKRILRIIRTYFELKYFVTYSVLGKSAKDYGDRKESHWSTQSFWLRHCETIQIITRMSKAQEASDNGG